MNEKPSQIPLKLAPFRTDPVQAEAATGARDAKMTLVKDSIRSARDVLMGLNRDNPDALGEFGFKVSDARSGNGGAPPPTP